MQINQWGKNDNIKEELTMNKNSLYYDVRSGTNILEREQFHDTIMAISDVATEMVIRTLGPGGASTVIDDGVNVYATKDGLHSLESLSFNDPVYNTIYRVLRSSSFNSAHKVGDGTTTAMVVSNSYMHQIEEILKEYSWASLSQRDIINKIKHVAEKIKNAILTSKDVKGIDHGPDATYDDIFDVAYIASNGDSELSNIIRTIYQKTGSPHIHIATSNKNGIDYEIISGYRFNCRPLDLEKFANTQDGNFSEVDASIHTYIFDHTVSFVEHKYIISAIIQTWAKTNSKVIIFAPHFDDIIVSLVSTANNNRQQHNQPPIYVLIQISIGTSLDRANIEDLGILMNCEIFNYPRASIFRSMIAARNNAEEFKRLEDDMIDASEYNYGNEMDIIEACTGTINTFTLKRDSAIIQGYEKVVDKQVYDNHMAAVQKKYDEVIERARLSNTTTAPEYMSTQARYNRLRGNVGVIHVGGTTNLEREFLNDTVEDAVFACRSAYEHGIIRGLNLTTLSELSNSIKTASMATNGDEVDHIMIDILNIFYNSFLNASLSVFENLGLEMNQLGVYHIINSYGSGSIVQMSPKEVIDYCIDNNTTVDLRIRKISDKMIVVNPVTTDIEIIDSVVSIVSTLMTSTQLLTRNRQFDRGMTRAIAQSAELDMIRMTKQAEAEGYISAFKDNDLSVNFSVNKK